MEENLNREEMADEDDLYYFESDHLALKGNRDYSELLKTIVILEAQQARAIKDIDVLEKLQNFLLENPLEYVDRLKDKEGLGIPPPLNIPELPKIHWEKYNVQIPPAGLKLINDESENDADFKPKANRALFKNEEQKGSTYNQPWSAEEQKKLEELLVKYPPEITEMRRFQKISRALGTRTVKQVSSRVQKYFLKLHRAGLPIPGRRPKRPLQYKQSVTSNIYKHQRHNHYLFKPTTFFPEYIVPVTMIDNDDDIPGPSNMEYSNSTVDGNVNETEAQIELLKRVKEDKQNENDVPLIHLGFKCDYCGEEPMSGTRWHCTTCVEPSIDYCSDCVVSQLNDLYVRHPLSHQLVSFGSKTSSSGSIKSFDSDEPQPGPSGLCSAGNSNVCEYSDSDSEDRDVFLKKLSESNDSDIYDEDYSGSSFSQKQGAYNYLDPNFLPR